MQARVFGILATISIALGSGVTAWAHHSFAAAYDTTTPPFEIHGVINSVRLENPHSWFLIDVKDPVTGKVDRWAFEAGTPSGMIRNGYKPNIIKAGTEVTIKAYHARDASQKRGMLNQLITSDGKVYGLFGPQETPGAK